LPNFGRSINNRPHWVFGVHEIQPVKIHVNPPSEHRWGGSMIDVDNIRCMRQKNI